MFQTRATADVAGAKRTRSQAPGVISEARRTGSRFITETVTTPSRVAFAIAALWVWGSPAANAQGPMLDQFCSRTAYVQRIACQSEISDDLFERSALCLNVSDPVERGECFPDSQVEFNGALSLCRDQLQSRLEVCAAVGEARFDPDFDPALFDDDFNALSNPNPYLPLGIGNEWHYEGGSETIDIRVLDETKLIEGVTCIVVNDVVRDDGELIEDTDDWFAQAKDGDVYYCGEEVKDYETFEGDDPEAPELVEIEGSFKVGRDGDKPGILVKAAPQVGDVFRQEWSVGNAEDVAEVLATAYRYGDDAELDEFVPQALAETYCSNGDCVVTREFTPLEPGAFERKYWALGIGVFLEVNPEDGEIVELVSCNFDARCLAP